MSARRLSEAFLYQHILMLSEYGDDVAVSRESGISHSTCQHRTRSARQAFPGVLPPPGTKPGWALGCAKGWKPRVRVVAPSKYHSTPVKIEPKRLPEPEEDDRSEVEKRTDATTINALQRKVRELTDQIIEERNWRKDMESLRAVPHEQVSWTPAAPAVLGASFLTPVLFASDFQVGEVVRPEEIDGINEYNQDIFVERYHMLIDKTIQMLTEHIGKAEFPGIYYLRGGDAISGEIHDELAETNDLSSVPAVRLLLKHEKEGIRRLREKFGRVRGLSIPGNHGRTTKKPRSSGYTERNFETLLAWWLADAFDSDPNVTFSIPKSGDAWFQIDRWGFLLAHGDRMGSKGGRGFVGPAATIARGHQKLYQNWTLTGRPVHIINTGHLHTSIKLERGFANGSLVGYNAFARDMQATPDAAKQWLYTVHKDRPIANMFEIELSPRPRRVVSDVGFGEDDSPG